MEKKRPDDIKFLFHTLSLSLIIVAVLVAFQPYFGNEPRLEEIKQTERQIVTLTPQDLPGLLKSKNSKPVMLVGYASWCYFCHQLMPVIVEMVRNHELDEVEPVFISLDDQPRKLSKYLVHHDYTGIVFPYMLDHGIFKRLSPAMEASGSGFSGVIPYIGFFNREGKIVSEYTGVANKQQLLAMAQKLHNGQ